MMLSDDNGCDNTIENSSLDQLCERMLMRFGGLRGLGEFCAGCAKDVSKSPGGAAAAAKCYSAAAGVMRIVAENETACESSVD